MGNRSSTSSSEAAGAGRWQGIPVAGLLALVLVLCADALVVSPWFPWSPLVSRVRPVQSVYWGVTRDRAELQRSRAAAGASVVVLGSSRGQTGFIREVAETAMPDVVFAKLSHALQDPVTVHALVPELIEAEVEIAVLVISHVDTHRPIRLEPLPAKSTSRVATLLPVLNVASSDLLLEHRESFYRVVASALSNLYRFRDQLGRAGANALREFPLGQRLEGRRGVRLQGPAVIGQEGPTRLPPRIERPLLARVPEEQRRWVYQLAWFAEVRAGPHVAVQFELIADAVEELRAAGVRVVIAECPVHGIGKYLEEPGTDAAFRSFATQLAEHEGVWFLPLPTPSPYSAADYMDLFHLNEIGGARFTRSILRLLEHTI
ncbi:MAG: DUF362 domain-containing protein [bacterium]|nr:DUF362 domain-containing protein [bacterium]